MKYEDRLSVLVDIFKEFDKFGSEFDMESVVNKSAEIGVTLKNSDGSFKNMMDWLEELAEFLNKEDR